MSYSVSCTSGDLAKSRIRIRISSAHSKQKHSTSPERAHTHTHEIKIRIRITTYNKLKYLNLFSICKDLPVTHLTVCGTSWRSNPRAVAFI